MRLFFGLKPDPQTCLDIDLWRHRMLPPMARPVPPHNLHLTLAFLGEVTERHLDRLTTEAATLNAAPIAMVLDQLGFYSRPQVLWIGPAETPEPAVSLARALRGIGGKLHLHTERRPFQAHLTIARRCTTPPPASAQPPCFAVAFDAFTLFESVNARSGVQYRAVETWPLG